MSFVLPQAELTHDAARDVPSARGGRAVPRDASHVIEQRFSVPFDFPVYFTEGMLHDPRNTVLRQAISRREPRRRHRFAVVLDSQVAQANPLLACAFQSYAARHADVLELVAAPRLIKGGELIKNDHLAVFGLQSWLHKLHMDRHACLVVVGGGSVLDMAGYAAATTHRGIRLIRVPTTVLAQNDSGVGVKTAINAFGAKNFLGTFTPPFAVINDHTFIDTLPARDRIAGMAEAVKVAAIRDEGFFDWLVQNVAALCDFEPAAMKWMIRRCAELHMQHIGCGGDPFEFGSARPLDFGHWAAHKLENLSGYALTHGEAVAIGLALDTRYSVACGLLPEWQGERLCRLLEQLGFRLWHDGLAQRDAQGRRVIMAGLAEFQEHLGGDLTVTMLDAIGRGREIHSVDADLMGTCIEWLRARDTMRCK
ncbi:MAG: 3-dehydroquinate synthase [Aquabacterium sp.]